jgi:hypothetical protein
MLGLRRTRPFALPFAEWGSVGLALPLPLLGGIKAHTLREEITHLEYKEITHFGYVLRPVSVLQSDYRQAGRPLNLPPPRAARLFSCLPPALCHRAFLMYIRTTST